MTYVVIALVFVDVAALLIGLSIRRKVTRIVRDTAADIERAVRAGIGEAVERFVQAAAALLGPGQPAGEALELEAPPERPRLLGTGPGELVARLEAVSRQLQRTGPPPPL